MQSTRCLITLVIELAARMEHGHDHFQSGFAVEAWILMLHRTHGNAAAIIADHAATVGADLDHDGLAMACHGFVNGVVDHLVDQVVQSGGRGVADIHGGTMAYRRQALQNLDAVGVVCTLGRRRSVNPGAGGLLQSLSLFVFADHVVDSYRPSV